MRWPQPRESVPLTQQRLVASIGQADYIQVQTHANAAQALDPPES